MKSTFARLSLIALTTVAGTALHAQPAGAPQPPGGPPSTGGPLPTLAVRTTELNQVRSGDYQLDSEHGRVIWSVSHHGFSKFSSMLTKNEGTLHLDAKNIANSKLNVTLHMDQVVTGISAEHFDKLLKSDKFFNTAKYPSAQFKSKRIEQVGPNKLKVTGDLTFRGLTKPLVIDATFNQAGEMPGGGYTVGFDGTATLKRSEYGADFLLPSIGDEVRLTIDAEFKHSGKAAAPAR